MKKIMHLFMVMFKIGIFTFGGGYAMITLIENEVVTKRNWLTHDEYMNMLAIAESTPGPIAINVATYLGYKVGKIGGAILATVGVVLPSFIIISIVYLIYDTFLAIKIVASAFQGIQVCVIFLILVAGLKMMKKLEKSIFNYIVFFLAFALIILFSLLSIKISTIYYILISAIVAVVINLITKLKKDKNVEEKK